MLTDSERFAFTFTTIHSFETTGNAYDGVMTSDRILTGDIIIIPSEKVVGLADAYPVAITAETGHLHGFNGNRQDFDRYCTEAEMPHDAAAAAFRIAEQLGYAIDRQFKATPITHNMHKRT